MFVTAKMVTPAGLPLNEQEDGLLPPELPEVAAYKNYGCDAVKWLKR